jgi:hypothetical protein
MNTKPIILFSLIFLIFALSSSAQQQDTISYRKPLFDFDPIKPTFKLTGEQLSNKNRFLRFSTLSGYREGVEPVMGFVNFASTNDKQTGTRRLYMYNLSIQDMLTYGFFKSNRVILEVKNPSKYRYDPSQGSKDNWLRENGHCFELVLPIGTIKEDMLINELSRVFGVKCGLQKRLVDALVLTRTSKIDKIKSLEKGEGRYDEHGYFNNVTLDRLTSALYEAGLPPMVDETGYTNPVDLNLNLKSFNDLAELKRELLRYDLKLREEKREVEMFVITEIR